MKFSPQQDNALMAVARWLKDSDQQTFRLFGFAGTGKTTLARYFAESVDGLVLYGSFTGKAAYVLRQKGCPNASTIHSMIYHSKERGRAQLRELERSLTDTRLELIGEQLPDLDPEEMRKAIDKHGRIQKILRLIQEERQELSLPMFHLNLESAVLDADLVVLDEISMVDGRIGEDILSFGTKLLVLGDPAQLPPVYGAGFFTEGIEPDIMLTDIHRQARDNPIIEMATLVRQEQALKLGAYGDSRFVTRSEIDEHTAEEADQILVGRNKTRHASNRRMRELKGHVERLPVPGDKLVCLRNNHDRGLLNGSIWHVDDVGEIGDERVYLTLDPDETGPAIGVEAHTHYFLGREESLPWWERKEAEEFDYGYALTVHKAQGSQWNNVLLFDESFCFRNNRWRWLYTGVTRAAEKLTIVQI